MRREGGTKASGDSYDNALAETINGLYKAEVIHRLAHGARSRPWSSRRWG